MKWVIIMDKHIRMALNSSAIIANSSWEVTCANILDHSKRIRRHWRRKDVIRLLCLVDIADSFESYPFYVNVTEKYGLNKLLQKYMNRIFRYHQKHIRTSYGNHNNGRIYSMETIRKYLKDGIDYIKTGETDHPTEVSGDNKGLNIKFTFDTDKLYDKYYEEPKDEVKDVVEAIARWKEYTGYNEPLPRMIYRGGGYEPY